MKIVRAICAILFIAGVALLALALHDYREQARFIDGAAEAPGEIIEVNRHVSATRKGTSTYYSFRVRFAPAGEPVDATVTDTSSSPRFAVGEKVALLYARNDPRRVNVDDFAMLWADVVVVFIIAAVLLASGGTAFWIAGGRPPGRRSRYEASLPEMQRAWRESRLTRDSEFQPVLIGFALAGFPLLGAIVAFVLFAPGVVQVIVVAILAGIAFRVIRDKRRARSESQRR